MAMVDLAGSQEQGPVKLADIAERQELSLSYLEQLFGRLRRAGLVRSVRGPGGGYLPCRPADKRRCQTHDLWEELGNQIFLFLNAVTLEDVLLNRVAGMSALRTGAPERHFEAAE